LWFSTRSDLQLVLDTQEEREWHNDVSLVDFCDVQCDEVIKVALEELKRLQRDFVFEGIAYSSHESRVELAFLLLHDHPLMVRHAMAAPHIGNLTLGSHDLLTVCGWQTERCIADLNEKLDFRHFAD
jgi:hypothetical protein